MVFLKKYIKYIKDLTVQAFGITVRSFFVWARPDYCVPYYKDTIVVTGHTPTQLIPGNDNPGYIYQKYNHIALDCGACFSEQGRLAGICLETGECFYSR